MQVKFAFIIEESAETKPSTAMEPEVSFSVTSRFKPDAATADVSPTVSVAETKKIKGRIDGMRGYNRAMKDEAIKLWRAANKK